LLCGHNAALLLAALRAVIMVAYSFQAVTSRQAAALAGSNVPLPT